MHELGGRNILQITRLILYPANTPPAMSLHKAAHGVWLPFPQGSVLIENNENFFELVIKNV